MNPNQSDASFWPDDGVILYDGVCMLCSGWMRFVLKRDRNQFFRFTPIQSDYGGTLARMLDIDPDNPDTNALIWRGFAYRRSDAALLVLSQLGGLGWTRLLRLAPRVLRDLVYRVIARNRYQWFGRRNVCDLGDRSYAGRIVTALPAELRISSGIVLPDR